MAKRPLYLVGKNNVEIIDIEFKWFPGFAKIQKQRSIKSFHEAASIDISIPQDLILEVSSKSENDLGIALSAFNLKTKMLKSNEVYSVESAFQGSKVFEHGGPYRDLIFQDSRAAKKDPRIKKSGKLKRFSFMKNDFGLQPQTAFYDWLYINVLLKNPNLIEKVESYRAFTDIEFNPQKSINCQAFALALFVLMRKNGIDMSGFNKPENYLNITKEFYTYSKDEELSFL